ncbi:MAG: HEPN domain-containing protein [Candidatus Hodarchaeales archaeon]|jgi:HEPN domain-containing protein
MISEITFHKAQDMINEAAVCFRRSRTLLDKKDYSGAIEASQHCVELSIKSLFVLFDFNIPFIHDPGKRLDEIVQVFEEIYPTFSTVEDFIQFKQVLGRIKYTSSLMNRLHNEGLYGFNGVPSSKLFRKRDAEYFSSLAFETCFSIIVFTRAIGASSGFLSEQEKAEFNELINLFKQLAS